MIELIWRLVCSPCSLFIGSRFVPRLARPRTEPKVDTTPLHTTTAASSIPTPSAFARFIKPFRLLQTALCQLSNYIDIAFISYTARQNLRRIVTGIPHPSIL